MRMYGICDNPEVVDLMRRDVDEQSGAFAHKIRAPNSSFEGLLNHQDTELRQNPGLLPLLSSWDMSEGKILKFKHRQQRQICQNNLGGSSENSGYNPDLDSPFSTPADFGCSNFMASGSALPPVTCSLPFNYHHALNMPVFPNCTEVADGFNQNGTNSASSVMYDLLQSTIPPTPILLENLFQKLPQNYASNEFVGLVGSSMNEKEKALLQEIDGKVMFGTRRRKRGMMLGETTGSKDCVKEKQRREAITDKYKILSAMIPHSTKKDRASIVSDATDYIKELLGTIRELKLLVDKKRYEWGRNKNQKHRFQEDGALGEVEGSLGIVNSNRDAMNHQRREVGCNLLRSSWLRRSSKSGTCIDVRIVDDEVIIKFSKRKKRNCLLRVSKVLEELHLQILQANGAEIGDHNIFLFNTKMSEDSCTHSSEIAGKLIEALDKQ